MQDIIHTIISEKQLTMNEELLDALKTIAHGKKDGPPLPRYVARDTARKALVAAGIAWTAEGDRVAEMLNEFRKDG